LGIGLRAELGSRREEGFEQRASSTSADAVDPLAPARLHREHTLPTQDREMARHHRLSQADLLDDVTDGAVTIPKHVQDLQADGVRERLQQISGMSERQRTAVSSLN
jgi:hypothetical protein